MFRLVIALTLVYSPLETLGCCIITKAKLKMIMQHPKVTKTVHTVTWVGL